MGGGNWYGLENIITGHKKSWKVSYLLMKVNLKWVWMSRMQGEATKRNCHRNKSNRRQSFHKRCFGDVLHWQAQNAWWNDEQTIDKEILKETLAFGLVDRCQLWSHQLLTPGSNWNVAHRGVAVIDWAAGHMFGFMASLEILAVIQEARFESRTSNFVIQILHCNSSPTLKANILKLVKSPLLKYQSFH